jgi:DNA repair protein RadA
MTDEANKEKKDRSNDNINSNNDRLTARSIDLELQDVEGIGPITTRKLKVTGIPSVMELAVRSVEQLAVDINSSKDSAAAFIMAAQKLLRESNVLEKEFVTADFVLEKRKSMLRCSTGSKSLDELLLGGIETQAVTEFYGEFGSGKSQICHTLCAKAKQPISEGELDGGVIYVDTEGTFRPERLQQIIESRGFVPIEVLKSTVLCKVYNSSHLGLIVKDLGRYISEFSAKLVVVDSIISLYRAEFMWRATLADRQQKLNSILHKLVRVAEIYDVAIVITNQVQTSPDTFFGDPTKAAGGNIMGHTSTYRIYLRKSGPNRIAKMVDAPYHPCSDARFTINQKGIDDLEDSTEKEAQIDFG